MSTANERLEQPATSTTHRFIRSVEIVLGIALGSIYLLAKVHYFTHIGRDNYFSQHWPYWAATAIVAAVAAILEAVDKWLSRSGSR
jgi:hypothetical protein